MQGGASARAADVAAAAGPLRLGAGWTVPALAGSPEWVFAARAAGLVVYGSALAVVLATGGRSISAAARASGR